MDKSLILDELVKYNKRLELEPSDITVFDIMTKYRCGDQKARRLLREIPMKFPSYSLVKVYSIERNAYMVVARNNDSHKVQNN